MDRVMAYAINAIRDFAYAASLMSGYRGVPDEPVGETWREWMVRQPEPGHDA